VKTPKAKIADYPLHKGKYKFTQLKTNASGFVNGPNGDRDVLVPKPEKLIRINCIGASTTGNYISEDAEAFSYPMELEKILSSSFHVPIEVNNYGMGGYNSAEIMVCFALRVIHTAPDFLIIYHAYNDITAYLTPGFSSDYEHCRQNLSANYWKYKISSKVPQLNSKLLNYLINRTIPYDIRNSLLSSISIGTLDIKQDPSVGLRAYERNLQHIIDLCKCNGIQVILSTCAFYMYEAIANDVLHQLYRSIVNQENDIMRGLAKKNDLPLVDNAKLILSNQEYFVDSIHLTPKGMNMLASNISSVLVPMIKSTHDNK
jgi:lysophospholipase L1-like esterase